MAKKDEPYEHQEYPKWVTPPDGVAVIAQNAQHEEELLGDASEEEPDIDALVAEAKALGINARKNWSAKKLQDAIADAKAE